MKTARWFTGIGSFILFASAILHTTGYSWLLHGIAASAIRPPMDGLLKASWLILAVEFLTLAVISFLALTMPHGGRIVLLCAACTGVTALLFQRFLGAFPGVYLLTVVTILFLVGGWLQAKQSA